MAESFSQGDYVEIIGPHESAGSRGYIFTSLCRETMVTGRQTATATATGGGRRNPSHYDVVIDCPPRFGLNDVPITYTAPIKVVPASCLKVVRGNNTVVTTFVCDYRTVEYPCLGMAATASTAASRFEPESLQARLPRPSARNLPGLPSALNEFPDDATERWFRELYKGNFVAQCRHTFELPVDDAFANVDDEMTRLHRTTPFFYIDICPLTDYDDDGDDGLQTVLSVILTPSSSDQASRALMTWHDDNVITDTQGHVLGARILHHLIRGAGYDMGMVPFLKIHEIVVLLYAEQDRWNDYRDAFTIKLDALVQASQQSRDHICDAINILGFALSATRNFQLAAEMLEQMRTKYADGLSQMGRFVSYEQQALAYLPDNALDRAEVICISGLCDILSAPDGGPSHEMFGHILRVLVYVYRQRSAVGLVESNASGDDNPSHFAVMHASLVSILAVCGWWQTQVVVAEHLVPQESILLPELRRKETAQSAFIDALNADSNEGFRAAVRSWAVEDFQPLLTPVGPPVSAKIYQKQAQHESRNILRLHHGVSTTATCSNPDCTVGPKDKDELERCARCKTTLYCSRECQVAHYATHKPDCLVNKK